MISFISKKIIGSQNEREIKKFVDIVSEINTLESDFIKLPSADLRNKTEEFRETI